MPVNLTDPAQVGTIMGSAIASAFAVWKAMRSPRRRPVYENGKRISHQEYLQSLEQAIANHGVKLANLDTRILQVDMSVAENLRLYDNIVKRLIRIEAHLSASTSGASDV